MKLWHWNQIPSLLGHHLNCSNNLGVLLCQGHASNYARLPDFNACMRACSYINVCTSAVNQFRTTFFILLVEGGGGGGGGASLCISCMYITIGKWPRVTKACHNCDLITSVLTGQALIHCTKGQQM